MVGLTRSVALELKKYNITANAYCPQADSPGHVAEFNRVLRDLGIRKDGAPWTVDELIKAVPEQLLITETA